MHISWSIQHGKQNRTDSETRTAEKTWGVLRTQETPSQEPTMLCPLFLTPNTFVAHSTYIPWRSLPSIPHPYPAPPHRPTPWICSKPRTWKSENTSMRTLKPWISSKLDHSCWETAQNSLTSIFLDVDSCLWVYKAWTGHADTHPGHHTPPLRDRQDLGIT